MQFPLIFRDLITAVSCLEVCYPAQEEEIFIYLILQLNWISYGIEVKVHSLIPHIKIVDPSLLPPPLFFPLTNYVPLSLPFSLTSPVFLILYTSAFIMLCPSLILSLAHFLSRFFSLSLSPLSLSPHSVLSLPHGVSTSLSP